MILKQHIGQAKQWLFNDGSQPFQVRVMKAGEIRRVEHIHKTMHEYFYVITGSLKLSVDGNIVKMKTDDLVIVEPGERHVVTEVSEDLRLLLIMPPPIQNDKLIIDNW
jgi:mannose-6-phosphate isomerase-like protein (cupin superfamily)